MAGVQQCSLIFQGLYSPRGPPSHEPRSIAISQSLSARGSSHTRTRAANHLGALEPEGPGRGIAPAGRDHRGAHVRLRCAANPDHARRGPLPVDRPFGESATFVRSPGSLCWTQAERPPHAGCETCGSGPPAPTCREGRSRRRPGCGARRNGRMGGPPPLTRRSSSSASSRMTASRSMRLMSSRVHSRA